jgi:hypothetical protein
MNRKDREKIARELVKVARDLRYGGGTTNASSRQVVAVTWKEFLDEECKMDREFIASELVRLAKDLVAKTYKKGDLVYLNSTGAITDVIDVGSDTRGDFTEYWYRTYSDGIQYDEEIEPLNIRHLKKRDVFIGLSPKALKKMPPKFKKEAVKRGLIDDFLT